MPATDETTIINPSAGIAAKKYHAPAIINK
jgi:hypothetical protein